MENFKIFFNHGFFMLEDKIEARLRRKENTLKKVISSMSNWYKKLLKFVTWQPQMLFKWNLSVIWVIYLHKVFFLRNTKGVTLRVP